MSAVSLGLFHFQAGYSVMGQKLLVRFLYAYSVLIVYLGLLVQVWFCCMRFGLFSTMPSDLLEERLRNDLFLC